MMQLNEYMSKKLSVMDQEDLCQDVMANAFAASDMGVQSDKDYNTFFYINHLTDEILKDTFELELDSEQLAGIKRFLFTHKDDPNYNLSNLTDLRILIYKWLSDGDLNKKAHPNISGIYLKPEPIDVNKWIATAKSMYEDINLGIGKNSAFELHTKNWDREEKQKFSNWLKYYEERTTEKYNVKNANLIKIAFDNTSLVFPSSWENPANRQVQPGFMAQDGKTKKEQEQDRAKAFKSKMKSRLRALKVLIDKYNDALPNQNVDKIYDELSVLEKSISKLNVYAALKDRVYRSAANMERFGFKDGANFLKTAAEAVPNGPTDETNLPPGPMKSNVEGVINRLEGISKVLKLRETVRDLAKVDIMLSELGMASFFPEITDALSKLIEGYSYSSNRIESVISKLRGTGKKEKTEPAPLPTAPAPAPVAPAAPLAAPVPTAPAPKPPTEKLQTGELFEKTPGAVQTTMPTKRV